MGNDILYSIGEALLLEVEGVKEIRYPDMQAYPYILIVLFENGKTYSVEIKEISELT